VNPAPTVLAVASPSPSVEAVASPGPLEKAAGEPPGQRGGTVTALLATEPDSLDPANALTLAAESVGRSLYDGLLSFGPDFEPRPALAERWSISPDRLIYTFTLRSGVQFQDGEPCDAAAALYNLQRFLGDETPQRRDLTAGIVQAARALDDLTLEVKLSRPYPFLHQLAQFGAALVSPRAHQRRPAALAREPVGTGPFRLVEWAAGRIVLERFVDCWRGSAALDGALLRWEADAKRRLERLVGGEAQLGGSVPFEAVAELSEPEPVEIDAVRTGRALGIAMNTQAPLLADRRVRLALNYALDRMALVREVYGGQADPLSGPLAPVASGAAVLQPYPLDPPVAQRLLAQAGYPNGLEAPLLVSPGRFPRALALAEAVQRQLAAVGVQVKLDLQEGAQYNAALTRAADETALRLALVGWLPPSGEARSGLEPLFHSSAVMPRGQNAAFFKNAELDALIDQGGRASNATEREGRFQRAQELLQREAPWLFLLSPHLLVARASGLHGLQVLPNEAISLTEQTWLE
jgi:glutathione transport system substrate-binding protein